MSHSTSRTRFAVWTALSAAVGGLLLVAVAWRAGALDGFRASAADAASEAAVASSGVAVVELFTSQGCSSCPPADRLLSELAAEPELAGRVFPLSFHVDYWNRLGWRDPFSARAWSRRQERYALALDSSVYTPQVVVNGRTEGVGSRRGQVVASIREALSAEPQARVEVSLQPETAGRWVASVVARWTEDGAIAASSADIWAALWHDGRVTDVTRGENADRSLANDRVVRHLEKVAALATGEGEARGSVVLAVDEEWGTSDLGVVVFVQDPRTLEIYGAAAARPLAPAGG